MPKHHRNPKDPSGKFKTHLKAVFYNYASSKPVRKYATIESFLQDLDENLKLLFSKKAKIRFEVEVFTTPFKAARLVNQLDTLVYDFNEYLARKRDGHRSLTSEKFWKFSKVASFRDITVTVTPSHWH